MIFQNIICLFPINMDISKYPRGLVEALRSYFSKHHEVERTGAHAYLNSAAQESTSSYLHEKLKFMLMHAVYGA